jgi:hypothetical protein
MKFSVLLYSILLPLMDLQLYKPTKWKLVLNFNALLYIFLLLPLKYYYNMLFI